MNVKLYNISFKILNNKFDAEDAVIQTFLNISDNIEKISNLPCPQIEPYCVVILKNESVNIIRKGSKVECKENINYLYRNSHQNETYNLEDEFLKTADKEILISCINRLSDDEKILFTLDF